MIRAILLTSLFMMVGFANECSNASNAATDVDIPHNVQGSY